jgi:Ca-activated chloride channel family protein
MSFIKKNITVWLISILVAFSLAPAMVNGESFNSKISQAMDHYQQEEYDQAANKFLSAEVEKPNNPALPYNLANSNYMGEKYEDALEAYKRAESSTTSPTIKQKALYNMGNTFFRMGKAKEAVGAYKKALEIDPSDMDAKYNLEFVRQEIKKQEQKRDKENKDNQDQPSKDEKGDENINQTPKDEDKDGKKDPGTQSDKKDENEEQEPSDQQNADKKPDEELNPPAPNQGPSENAQNNVDGNKPSQAKESNGELSEEEAERWLSSLTEDNKKFNKNQSHSNMNDVFNYQGNDW